MHPMWMDGDLALQNQGRDICIGVTEKFRLQKEWDDCMGWRQGCTAWLL